MDQFRRILPLLSLLMISIFWFGCESKLDPLSAPNPVDSSSLFNFPSPSSVQVNPNLPLVGGGTVGLSAPLPVAFISFPVNVTVFRDTLTIHGTTCSSPGCSVQPTGGQSTVEASGFSEHPLAVHVFGWIEDPESPLFQPGPGNYDSVYVRAYPNYNGGGFYDVSAYSGMQFYLKVASDDNAPAKQFHVPINQTTGWPPAPGVCVNPNDPGLVHCWDDFYYDYTDVTRDQWVFVQKRWAEFKQYGNGSIPNPPTLSGDNLKHVIGFQWVEGNSAQAGPFTVDFMVTGAKFF